MNPLDDLLAATGQVDDITPEQLRRAAGPVRYAASADPGITPFTGGRRSRGGLRGRLALTAAAASVAAGVVTVSVLASGTGQHAAIAPTHPAVTGTGSASPSGTSKPAEYTTAAMLLRAAGNAAGAQQGGWPDAAYWHVTSTYTQSGHTYQREIWIGHHASGVLIDHGVGPGVMPLGPGVFPDGHSGVTWDQLYAMPTDPAALGALLANNVKDFGPDPNPTGGVSSVQEEYVSIGDLLRESPASPALRKALYDVAAGIPGVRLVGNMKDARGRTGVGVERNGETLLIDPATGQLLADIVGTWTATYVTQGPASSAPAATTK
jgi:hypothetical protein